MRSMSFNYTIEPFLARAKSVTRRDWNDKYASFFNVGDKVRVYDKSPMYGGLKMGIIELTHKPYREHISKMPQSDYLNEGFKHLEDNGFYFRGQDPKQAWLEWKERNENLWVIRFNIIEINPHYKRRIK